MNKECKVASVLVLAMAFCFTVVSVVQARGRSLKTTPIWQITQGTKGQSVTWKKHRPNQRFAIYDAGTPADESDDLVLDKETGLVWARSPDIPLMVWPTACTHCYQREIGNRMGWRLPTIEELASLVDNDNSDPALPTGHPFVYFGPYSHWSSTTDGVWSDEAYSVFFSIGSVSHTWKGSGGIVWCVRGGQGHQLW